jgi:uncharacterized protein (DUF4415 family)
MERRRNPGSTARLVPDFVSLHPGDICYDPGMTRRTPDARSAAEKAFKAATTKPPPELPLLAKAPSLPGAKELVSLRVDRDVLDFFQQDGPGWQERINAALRKAAEKS